MIPNGSPAPPIPIPDVSKSLLPGGKKIRKYTFVMIPHNFNEKIKTIKKIIGESLKN